MNKPKKSIKKLKQTKDYYPIVNPNAIENTTNVSIPSEDDLERAKRWVDETQK